MATLKEVKKDEGLKLEAVRFYQAVPLGVKLETFLTTKNGAHEELNLVWNRGILKVESKALKKPLFIPSANIMYFVPEDKGAKIE